MDLNQFKLSKEEWNNLEIPISKKDKNILNLIYNGFNNIDIFNENVTTLISYLKVTNSSNIDKYIYITYIEPKIQLITNLKYKKLNSNKITIKKADKIRFNNTDTNIIDDNDTIFEFTLVYLIKNLYSNLKKEDILWNYYYYTLSVILNYNLINFNYEFKKLIEYIIYSLQDKININYIVYYSVNILQNNPLLLTYKHTTLFQHQKDLYKLFNNKNTTNIPKLIFYIAPTGTGKTLSPLGLLNKYKVIFVCAARHIGLSLAKNAINIHKKIAFAFGCDNEQDIRLHYFSAKKYDKNYKTGGIYRVDNSEGENVELIISDIKSYITAMNYMLRFNKQENIITYWDEPTITLDKEKHDIHNYINFNCKNNKIQNFIFSCATMPPVNKLTNTINTFKKKFNNSEIIEINSYDCSKTIRLVNIDSYVEMPHYLYNDYNKLKQSLIFILNNKTLLRYLDLTEVIKLIKLINEKYYDSITNINSNALCNYFKNIEDITIENIKIYYLKLLLSLDEKSWLIIYKELILLRKSLYNSVINISTYDSYTLTDGPTLYLTNNVDNIAKFLISKASIPDIEINRLMTIINNNNNIIEKITDLKKIIDEKYNDIKKIETTEYKELNKEIKNLQNKIKTILLDEQYIPNFTKHIQKYANNRQIKNNLFKSNISESIIKKIMLINIEEYWKLLLIMGIGVFSNQKNKEYIEIMKYLADNQKLFLIIASTDYIYGTNYQFCHCYIGKDLYDITQEKLIQSIGRVGRINKQRDYTIRFRNNQFIDLLFTECDNNIETINFNNLYDFS